MFLISIYFSSVFALWVTSCNDISVLVQHCQLYFLSHLDTFPDKVDEENEESCYQDVEEREGG